jgi:hypothetical protein
MQNMKSRQITTLRVYPNVSEETRKHPEVISSEFIIVEAKELPRLANFCCIMKASLLEVQIRCRVIYDQSEPEWLRR